MAHLAVTGADRFWVGRRVFVTGHTGFKGSWLSLWLQALGAELCGYALEPPTDPSLFELAHVAEGMQSLRGDVRDLPFLIEAISRFAPEVVLHLAAQPLVRASYADPVETFSTNVIGTVNVLEAVRRTRGVRAVVIVTSDKCYENREWVWGYRETDALGGHDPYSSSKACAELVTSAFRRSFFPLERFVEHGVAIASARAGNVIGGGDWGADRLVPDVLRSFLAGRPLLLRNPDATRPWQHVLDPLSGYLLLARRLSEGHHEFADAWNFGPDEDGVRPVAWVADRLIQSLGGRARVEVDGAPKPHEAGLLRLDCSKAKSKLGWRPQLRLHDALDLTLAWFRVYGSGGGDLRGTTLAQIANFTSRLGERVTQ